MNIFPLYGSLTESPGKVTVKAYSSVRRRNKKIGYYYTLGQSLREKFRPCYFTSKSGVIYYMDTKEIIYETNVEDEWKLQFPEVGNCIEKDKGPVLFTPCYLSELEWLFL